MGDAGTLGTIGSLRCAIRPTPSPDGKTLAYAARTANGMRVRLSPLEEEMLAPSSTRRERVLISMFPALPVPPMLLVTRPVLRELSDRSFDTITSSAAFTIKFPLLPTPKVDGEMTPPSVTFSRPVAISILPAFPALKVEVNAPEALISTAWEALILTFPPSPAPTAGLAINAPSRSVNCLVSIAISPALPAPTLPVMILLSRAVTSGGCRDAARSRARSRPR